MKNFYFLFLMLFAFSLYAQAPNGIYYQTTVRNSSGVLIVNQNVYFKFNIIQNFSTNAPVFSETHFVPTDNFGQVKLTIGQGTATINTFSQIDWSSGLYYLEIELNTGAGFISMGVTQLESVPYALYANTAGNDFGPVPNLVDVLTVSNSANNNKISNLQNPTNLQDATTKGYLNSELQTEISILQSQLSTLHTSLNGTFDEVTIGTQIWMDKNLDVSYYTDGTVIPQITDLNQWITATTGAWCYYNNDPITGKSYGKLYNWYAIMGIHDAASLTNPSLRKQLAPVGWHIPLDSEWTILNDFLGGNAIAGSKMKQVGLSHWFPTNNAATNDSAFDGLPGGFRPSVSGISSFLRIEGYWWSATNSNSTESWYRRLNNQNGIFYRESADWKNGFSVRCIKN